MSVASSNSLRGDVGGDRAPQLLDPSGRRVEQDEHGGPQRAGGSVEFRELLVAAVLVFAGGLGEQPVDDLVRGSDHKSAWDNAKR